MIMLAAALVLLQDHPFAGLNPEDEVEITYASGGAIRGRIMGIAEDRGKLSLNVTDPKAKLQGTIIVDAKTVQSARKLGAEPAKTGSRPQPLMPAAAGARWTYRSTMEGKPDAVYECEGIRRIGDLDCAVLRIGDVILAIASTDDGIFLLQHSSSKVPHAPIRLVPSTTLDPELKEERECFNGKLDDAQPVVVKVRPDRITVPAGTYDAVLSSMHISYLNKPLRTERFWFAPGVGIVKFDQGSEEKGWLGMELKSYEPGRETSTVVDAPAPDDPDGSRTRRLIEVYEEFESLTKQYENADREEIPPSVIERFSELGAEMKDLLSKMYADDDVESRRLFSLRLLKKHAPTFYHWSFGGAADRRHRIARTSLMALTTAQESLRSNDMDRNRVPDYWVADVSGLYRILNEATGNKIAALNDHRIARADAAPAVALDREGSAHGLKLDAIGAGESYEGYYYVVVARREAGGRRVNLDEGNGRNPDRFAICAYPDEYGTDGTMTFVVTEEAKVYEIDNAGKPIDVLPADLPKAGWTRSEDR